MPGMTPSRILIADSNPDMGRFLQNCLVRAGYSVPLVASGGDEALDHAFACAPDLALVNATLAGQPDGFETARRLRQFLSIPILFLAPHGGDFSLNRARAPLGTAYLTGPLSESDVLSAVAASLRQACVQGSQERQRRTLEQTLAALREGVIATDLAGMITYLNPRAAALLDIRIDAVLGSPLSPLLLQANLDSAVSTTPLEQPDGSVAGCLHLLAHSGSEPALTRPPALDPVTSISDPLLILDPGQAVVRLNDSAATLLGGNAAELVGASLWSHLPASAREKHAADLRRVLEERSAHSFQLHLDSANTWWQGRAFPMEGQLLLLLQDITEQKRAAAESERIARLEGLSHLARGFTHDFNNLLTILMGNLALARAQSGQGELHRLLEEAEAATRRARDLVEQLTTFAKGGAPIKGMIPLRPLLNEVLGRRPASSRIAYHTRFEGTEFTLDADPKQLRRLLENLILNAEQAITGSGEIHIRCYRLEESPSAEGSAWLIVEIRDTGCGMCPETLSRAFDPFFTTRTQANATGLGLTVCESIAKAHGGSIRLRSEAGQGTAAEVRFPIRAPDPASAESPPPALPHSLNGRSPSSPASSRTLRRILILEDEKLIRRLIYSTLTHAGFQVDETWDGQQTVEAYRQAKENGHPYDLLIMDLAIENGMGGVEAMNRIRNFDPAALAIVSSGYSDDPAMARPLEYGFTSVLPKPYQPRHLVEAVEELLAQHAS